MKVLLDTNICIYIIRNKPQGIRQKLQPFKSGDVGVSSVTVAELRYGAAKSQAEEKNAQALEAFLHPLETVPFDDGAAMVYGGIRAELEKKGTPIGTLDFLIAAQAISLGITLVTNNTKEFKRISGLKLENWV